MNALVMLGRLVFAAAFIVLMGSRPLFAGEHEDAKLHYSKGTKAYEIGAYDEAIKEYGEAYRLVDDPALLYDLGQVHRLAGHTIEALRAYRMFLLKMPTAPNRSEVEDRIAELQKQHAAAQHPQPPLGSEPSTNAPPHTPPASARPAPSVVPRTGPFSPSHSAAITPAQKKLIAGGVVAGLGGLAIVGGIVSGVLATNAGHSITNAAQMGQTFDYATYHSGQVEQAAEIALLTVGGAAAIAGATAIVIGKRESKRVHAWLQPLIGRGATGLALGGAF
jgi:tetratricopeptide (TPR) repeat protein